MRIIIINALILTLTTTAQATTEPEAGISRGRPSHPVSLTIPGAPRGLVPRLNLVVDPLSVGGIVGDGLRFTAGSTIEQRSAMGTTSNFNTSPQSDDTVYLDGQELIERSGYWEPEIVDGSRLTYDTATNTWRHYKASIVSTYGGPEHVDLTADGSDARHSTQRWHLQSRWDTAGDNTVEFTYSTESLLLTPTSYASIERTRLAEITYAGGNVRIEFVYGNRRRTKVRFVGGQAVVDSRRLEKIKVFGANDLFIRSYWFEYADEGGKDCQGDSAVPETKGPNRVRRILEAGHAGAKRMVRCFERTAPTTPTFQAINNAIPELTNGPHSYFGDALDTELWKRRLETYSADLDRDGRTDLIVLASHCSPDECRVFHDVLLASQTQPGRFEKAPYILNPAATQATGVSGYSARQLLSARWRDALRTTFTGEWMADPRGFAVTDLDADGALDFVVEKVPGDAAEYGDVVRLQFDGVGFVESDMTAVRYVDRLTAEQLRAGFFADIDGNGFPDYCRLASASHCRTPGESAPTITAGSSANIWVPNPGNLRFVDMSRAQPLTLPLANGYPDDLQAQLDTCGDDPYWEEEVAFDGPRSTRFTDVNGDGVTDAVVALRFCKFNKRQSVRQDRDYFARVYLGTGLGTFIDSGWGPGDELANSTAALVDWDGDGHASWSRTHGTNWLAKDYVNVHAGFAAGTPSSDWFQLHYEDRLADVYGGLMGDFNADGLIDTLRWPQGPIDRTLLSSYINTSEVPHRISTIVLPEGGRIHYGFDRLQVGDMDRPTTVVASIDGEEGLVRYAYRDGYTDDQQFVGFRQVERVAMNGSRQVFGFQFDETQGSGTLTYTGLYTANSTLISAEVTVRGYPTEAGFVQAGRKSPVFNPVARKCSYALGLLAARSLQTLVDECWSWETSSLVPTTRQHFYTLVSTPTVAPLSNLAAMPGAQQLAAPDPTLLTPVAPTPPANLRDASGEARSLTRITEYTADEATGSLLTLTYHGDPTTDLDDTVTTHTYTQVALAGGLEMPRLDSTTLTGGGVRRYRITYSDYPALRVALPGTEETCGKTETTVETAPDDPSCTTTHTTYTSNGMPEVVTFPDGTTEHYAYNWCGKTTSTTDRVGRVSTANYGHRCWHRTTTVGQTVTRYFRDQFGRTHTTKRERQGATTTVEQAFFDDEFPTGGPSSRARSATIDARGKATFHFSDGFGRSTRVVECEAAFGNTDGAGIDAEVTCAADGLQRVTRKFYRNDGKLMLVAGPSYASDWFVPVVRTLYSTVHDDVIGMSQPGTSALCPQDGQAVAPSLDLPCSHRGADAFDDNVLATLSATPQFVPTWAVASARYKRDIASSGVVTQVNLETPFDLVTTRNGEERERKVANRFGMHVRLERAGQPTRVLTYNDAWLLASTAYQDQAECVADSGAPMQPCSYVESYIYDLNGHVLETTSPSGTVLSTPTDALGRPLGSSVIVDGVETVTSIQTYMNSDGVTRSSTATDEAGNSTITTYDDEGRPVARSLPWGFEAWTYTVAGGVENHTDSAGLVTTRTYDVFGRPDTVTRPGTGTTAFTFDAKDAVLSETDSDGAVRTTLRATNGTPTAIFIGNRLDTLVNYDPAGRPTANWKSGIQRYFAYDTKGRLRVEWSASAPDAAPLWTRTLTYDEADRVRMTTIAPMAEAEATTEHTFDAWGRVFTSQDGLGRVTTYHYDVEGAARRVILPGGAKVLSDFDARGRMTYERKPEIGRATYATVVGTSYTDSFGVEHVGLTRSVKTDGDNFRRRQWRDGMGRLVAIKHRDNTRSEYGYTTGDSSWSTLRKLDTEGRVVSESRRVIENGLVTLILGPDLPDFAADAGGLRRIEYGYTAAGRRERITTNDDETLIHYEPGSGLARQELYGASQRTLIYEPGTSQRIGEDRTPLNGDTLRRLRSRFDAAGRVVERLATVPDPTNSNVTQSSRQTLAGYDAMGNATVEKSFIGQSLKVTHTWSFDAVGQPLRRATIAHGQTQTTRWAWRDDGRLDTLTPPSNQAMKYVYDSAYPYRLSTVVHHASGTVVGRFEAYNNRGLPTAVSSLGRALEFEHDGMGRQTRRTSVEPNGVVTELLTTFNALGQVASETLNVAGDPPQVTDYGYTPAGYLAWEMLDNTTTTHYVTDPSGNRLMTQLESPYTGTQEVMNASWEGHRLVAVNGQPLTYDPWEGVTTDHRGTVLRRNPTGHVSTVNPGGDELSFTRDANHMPIVAATPQGRWTTTWDLRSDSSPIEQMRPDGTRVISVKAGGLQLAEVVVQNGNVMPVALLHDQRGSLRAANGAQSARSSAFGLGTSSPSNHESRFVFHGMESYSQAPGVHFARHRAYDAETGRFLRPDPAGLVGGVHRTIYADANPLNGADPLGLWCTVRRFLRPEQVVQLPDSNPTEQGSPIGGDTGWDTSMTLGTSPVDAAMAAQANPFSGIDPIDGDSLRGPAAPDGCPIGSLCDPSEPLNPVDQPVGTSENPLEEARRMHDEWCASNGIGAAKCNRIFNSSSKDLRVRWRKQGKLARRNRRNVRRAIRTARRGNRSGFRSEVKHWRSEGMSGRQARLCAAGFCMGAATLIGDWTPKSANPGALKGPFLPMTAELSELASGSTATPSFEVEVLTPHREVEVEIYEGGQATGRTTWLPEDQLTNYGAYDYTKQEWKYAMFNTRSMADIWADSIGATLLLADGRPTSNEAGARLIVLGVRSYTDNYHTKLGISAALYSEMKPNFDGFTIGGFGVSGKAEVPILGVNLDLLQGANLSSVESKYSSTKLGQLEMRAYPDKDRVRLSGTLFKLPVPGLRDGVAWKAHLQHDPSGTSVGSDLSGNIGLVGNLRLKGSIGSMTNLTNDPSQAFSRAIQMSRTSTFISLMNQEHVRTVWR